GEVVRSCSAGSFHIPEDDCVARQMHAGDSITEAREVPLDGSQHKEDGGRVSPRGRALAALHSEGLLGERAVIHGVLLFVLPRDIGRAELRAHVKLPQVSVPPVVAVPDDKFVGDGVSDQ
ncbi:unnamed protein product, partial [Prorocentrum cordatum]